MAKRREVRRLRRKRTDLTIEQILDWADRFQARHGRWPTGQDGKIEDDLAANWSAVNEALRVGFCGLPGGSSIAQVLAEFRGHRNRGNLPNLTVKQILAWADEHYQRTQTWPRVHSGPIPNSDGETWNGVNHALCENGRGLTVQCSLATLLENHRGVVKHKGGVSLLTTPELAEEQILCWGDDWHARTGRWPSHKDGPVAPGLAMTSARWTSPSPRAATAGRAVHRWRNSGRQNEAFAISSGCRI